MHGLAVHVIRTSVTMTRYKGRYTRNIPWNHSYCIGAGTSWFFIEEPRDPLWCRNTQNPQCKLVMVCSLFYRRVAASLSLQITNIPPSFCLPAKRLMVESWIGCATIPLVNGKVAEEGKIHQRAPPFQGGAGIPAGGKTDSPVWLYLMEWPLNQSNLIELFPKIFVFVC